MKKITCLYDINDWAIFNLFEILKSRLSSKYTLDIINYKDYYRKPYTTDILYIGFLFLYKKNFDYRKYASELICTIHDPNEISNFRNTYNWQSLPLRYYDLNEFDRVSSISDAVAKIIEKNYSVRKIYNTPTFSFFRPKNESPEKSNKKINIFSSTNLSEYHTLRHLLSRVKYLGDYFFDQEKKISINQIKSLFFIKTRKNIKELRKIKQFLSTDMAFCDNIRFGKKVVDKEKYKKYLREADIYICTSFMEGGPIPLAEAAANGTALLSTKVGQVEEILQDGENGFFCTSYSDFKIKLEFYRDNPDILENHKSRSQKIMSELEDSFPAWEKFFDGV